MRTDSEGTRLVTRLLGCPQLRVHSPVSTQETSVAASTFGPRLPMLHLKLLARSDGVSTTDGLFRMFGVSAASGMPDLVGWNELSLWKWAWPPYAKEYFCFGETVWGDQYAYRMNSSAELVDSTVYFLDALELFPEPMWNGFEEFLEGEFLRNAIEPYDVQVREVRRRLGAVPLEKHVVRVPSPLITGDESKGDLMMLPAAASMVMNGDLARQLLGPDAPAVVAGVEPYVDTEGRSRLRVV